MTAAPVPSTTVSTSTSGILLRPYLTEKSSRLAELGQYTFLVARDAEKVSIARAVEKRYGVHSRKVTIVRLPGKTVRYGKTIGRRSAFKKAIIAVRAGEKIPFGVKT